MDIAVWRNNLLRCVIVAAQIACASVVGLISAGLVRVALDGAFLLTSANATNGVAYPSVNPSLDFGITSQSLSLGDYVWHDADKDGRQDDDEADAHGDGTPDGAALAIQTTDLAGKYLFANLRAGNYLVEFVAPNSFALTAKGQGDAAGDSDAEMVSGRTGVIALNSGALLTVDAGVVSDVQIIKSSDRPNQSLVRGDVIIYSIDVINSGDTEIQNVTLTDPVPANTEYVAGSGAPAPSATAPLRWIFTLPARATRRFSFAARVVSVPSGSTRIVTKATLTLGNRTIDSNEVVNPLQATAKTSSHFEARGSNSGALVQLEPASLSIAQKAASSTTPLDIAQARIATVEHTRIALNGVEDSSPLTESASGAGGAATAASKPARSISLSALMALSLGIAILLALLVLGISAVMRRGRPRRVAGT